MSYVFPEGFLWGGATAANQCEGVNTIKAQFPILFED